MHHLKFDLNSYGKWKDLELGRGKKHEKEDWFKKKKKKAFNFKTNGKATIATIVLYMQNNKYSDQ